jgi:predicted ester cyclase
MPTSNPRADAYKFFSEVLGHGKLFGEPVNGQRTGVNGILRRRYRAEGTSFYRTKDAVAGSRLPNHSKEIKVVISEP